MVGDGVDAALSPTASQCAKLVMLKSREKERASVKEVSIIGVDLAKNVFQLHGAAADGTVVFRKKLSRPQFGRFMRDHPACEVAMEACPSAHHWARELTHDGHHVRLIAPHYVKPFLKRQKNDAADAEAIVEAALRPTMRFVEPKTADQQARAVAFRTREQLVKQRTEAVNALRSHLYEFGYIAPVGIGYVPRLLRVVEDPEADIPDLAREICRMLLEQIAQLTDRINALKTRIATISNEVEMPRRLQTMPGGGPITALAVETFAPPMEQFRRGRDFVAWLGLVPRSARPRIRCSGAVTPDAGGPDRNARVRATRTDLGTALGAGEAIARGAGGSVRVAPTRPSLYRPSACGCGRWQG